MEDPLTAVLDTFFDAGFFDVHVVGIQQQAEVIRANPLDEVQSLGNSC